MIEAFSATEYGRLALIAADIAREAASHIRSSRQSLSISDLSVQTKASETDPVTAVDKSTERLIRDRLHTLRPEDRVLGEENIDGVTTAAETSAYRWIVDPIDGTVNFLYEIPAYAVSIACEKDGEVVAAAVIDVPHEALYLAAAGQGSYRVEGSKVRELTCSAATKLSTSLVATGFSCMPKRRQRQGELLLSVIQNVRDIRRLGAAALDCCRVADATVEAYYEHGISGWDYAAGALIAKEAGAVVSLPDVNRPSQAGELVLIAAPGISEQLKTQLRVVNGLAPIPEV